jgi:hypothetical protein
MARAVADSRTVVADPVGVRCDAQGRPGRLSPPLVFSPDGRYLAAGLEGHGAVFWELATRTVSGTLPLPEDPGGRRVFVPFPPPMPRDGGIWSPFEDQAEYGLPDTLPFLLAWSPDGRMLVAGRRYRPVAVFSAGCAPDTSLATAGMISDLAWNPDGRHLVTAGSDGTLAFWDAREGVVRASVRGPHRLPVMFGWNATGEVVAVGDGEQTVQLRGRDGSLRATLAGSIAAWDPRGTVLAVASDGGPVRLHGVSGRELRALPGPATQRGGLAFSPDGRRLAALVARPGCCSGTSRPVSPRRSPATGASAPG